MAPRKGEVSLSVQKVRWPSLFCEGTKPCSLALDWHVVWEADWFAVQIIRQDIAIDKEEKIRGRDLESSDGDSQASDMVVYIWVDDWIGAVRGFDDRT